MVGATPLAGLAVASQATRLELHTGKRRTRLLGLNDGGCLAVEIQEVIGGSESVCKAKLANCYSTTRVDVGFGQVGDSPTGSLKQPVDVGACSLLW